MTSESKTLQVGATVKVSNRHGEDLATIERETKTQWVIDDGRKFSKKTERLVGERSAWAFTKIRAVTDDEAAEFRAAGARRAHARYLAAVEWKALDLDTLRSLVAMVKAASGMEEL